MARQIDQDIDLVALNLGEAGFIVLAAQIAPVISLLLQARRVVVVLIPAGIERDLQFLAVPLLQQGLHEVTHRVAAEIR